MARPIVWESYGAPGGESHGTAAAGRDRTGELENLTVCAPLKVPARTRSDGEFHGPFDAKIEDFFDFERSEINEDASIRVPFISMKFECF